MERVRCRAHHLFCKRFMKFDSSDRGTAFDQVNRRMTDVIEAADEVSVELCEGVDDLCRVCPECQDGRCRSAQGDETAVRKWDSIIVSGLEVSYGETRTAKDWRVLVQEKAPLKFCHKRCPYKERCSVFHMS